MDTVRVQAGNMGHLPWDPKSSEPVRWAFNAAVFTPLIKFNKQYKLSPGIIKSWYWNESEKSYTFEIDNSLIFDAARKLTVQDVEFAILKPFLSKYEVKERQPLLNIVGVKKLKLGDEFTSGMCEGVKIVSASKIKIFLEGNDTTFLYSLGVSVPPVGPIESYREDMYTFKKYPLGTGNYKIDEIKKDKGEIFLSRKKLFTRDLDKNPPNKIHFFTQNQGVDNRVDLGVMAGARKTKDNKYYTRFVNDIPVAIQVIDFNYSNKFGKNKDLREIISLSINRNEITDGYDQALPAHELVPELFYGRTEEKFEHDADKARKLMQEKFPNLYKKKRLKAWYHGIPGENLPRWLQKLQRQFSDVGLNVEFIGSDEQKMTSENSDILFYVYGTPITFVDPLLPFASYTPETLKSVHTDRSDLKASKLFKSASKAPDRMERAERIKELWLHLKAEYRTIPIAERRPIFAYSKNIKEIGRNSLFLTYDYELVRTR